MACCNRPVFLQFGKEVLHKMMTCFISVCVIVRWIFAVWFRRNDRGILFFKLLLHPFISIVGFIGKESLCLGHLIHEHISSPVQSWSWQNAVGFPDASHVAWLLVVRLPLLLPISWSSSRPFFERLHYADELWQSLSRSSHIRYLHAAKVSKIFCQMPVLLYRLWRIWITLKSPKHSGKSRHGMPAR